MDISVSKPLEIVKDREARRSAVLGVADSNTASLNNNKVTKQ